MSNNFTDNIIQRFFNEGEVEFSQNVDFLVDRISLATQIGVANYVLPDYVKSIRRVTYLGNKVWPMSSRTQRTMFQGSTVTSTSFWYIYDNVSQNQIQFTPAPSVAIPLVTNVWDTDIANGLIIEYSRVADNVNFKIPESFRRQLLKAFVGKKLFAIEGAGQNLKMSQYFDLLWQQRAGELKELIEKLFSNPRRLVVDRMYASNIFDERPLLPINRFGVAVDDEY